MGMCVGKSAVTVTLLACAQRADAIIGARIILSLYRYLPGQADVD